MALQGATVQRVVFNAITKAAVTEAMKQITEDSVARTGYEPKLQAMHHSEIQPATESHRDPTGQALENAMKAAHDGAGKPNKGAAA